MSKSVAKSYNLIKFVGIRTKRLKNCAFLFFLYSFLFPLFAGAPFWVWLWRLTLVHGVFDRDSALKMKCHALKRLKMKVTRTDNQLAWKLILLVIFQNCYPCSWWYVLADKLSRSDHAVLKPHHLTLEDFRLFGCYTKLFVHGMNA